MFDQKKYQQAIIFDFMRTLYDPDSHILVDGALEILEYLRQRPFKLFVIGRGSASRQKLLERHALSKYFEDIYFSEHKDVALFQKCVDRSHLPPEDFFVVGDRVRSEISIGNDMGMTTIWLRNGRFAGEEPRTDMEEPDHTIRRLSDLQEIL